MAYVGNNLTVQQYAPQIAYFSGNGSTTVFTLPIGVVTAAQILVVVANVPQNPSSSYSVSGTTLTFTSAPPSGTNNIWVEYTSLQTNLIQPANGTVTPASLSVPNALYWDTSANVGIGTTSPAAPLQVTKSTAVDCSVSITNAQDANAVSIGKQGATAFGQTAAGNAYLFSGADWSMMSYGGVIKFATGGSTERMRIDSSGNVGIGTSSPSIYRGTFSGGYSQVLALGTSATLSGEATYSGYGSSIAGALNIYQNSGNSYLRYFDIGVFGDAGPGGAGSIMRFLTQTTGVSSLTERMRIDSSGNVFVGGTTANNSASPIYSKTTARAWVNFNGSNGTINASLNISSVTRTGTGAYTVNFTNAFANTSYVITGFAQNWTGVTGNAGICYGVPSTTSCLLETHNYNTGGSYDPALVGIAIFSA